MGRSLDKLPYIRVGIQGTLNTRILTWPLKSLSLLTKGDFERAQSGIGRAPEHVSMCL